jgi:hypothetical protein
MMTFRWSSDDLPMIGRWPGKIALPSLSLEDSAAQR